MWKRKIGRPQNGRVVFKKPSIDALPKQGTVSEVARALGVKVTTVQQWYAPSQRSPLQFTEFKGRKYFNRVTVVRWLIDTRRYTPEPKYELGKQRSETRGGVGVTSTELA